MGCVRLLWVTHMDIARPSQLRRKRVKQALYGVAGVTVALLITAGVARLQPASPSVERATVWIDTVKRGPMVRQVRGLGTLVSEDLRWIPAATSGRVESIVLRPGTRVTADTTILELSNPTLEQEAQDAALKLRAAEAGLVSLHVQLDDDVLQQRATAATIEAEFKKATLQADINRQLAAQRLVSAFTLNQSQLDADQLKARHEIAQQQIAHSAESVQARLAERQAQVDQARAFLELKQREVAALRVRAGVPGILQLVAVEVGQQVMPGINLARIVNPSRLKAEIKIPETQAKDVQVGQPTTIDTRNGIVEGRVMRIDPSVQNGTVTVDVALEGPLPNGARPDLSVDGTIELERLDEVVFVGRPAFGQEQGTIMLFRLQPGGMATRTQVKLGRSSVSAVEVVSGVDPGDQVILSDMSAWDAFDRVRLQ
jgi:HlyD family secretion protein